MELVLELIKLCCYRFDADRSAVLDQEPGKATGPGSASDEKGKPWHFCYKAHIEVDMDSGLEHNVKVTAANVSDVATTPELLTGEEEVVYGDSGYLGTEKSKDAVVKNKQGKKIRYKINHRPSQIKNRSLWSQGQLKRREREKSSIRAKVEHVFAVVKGMFRYRKRGTEDCPNRLQH